jgi:hypothetical protein
MTDHIIYGSIGAIIGFLIGGFVVGSICGKEYKKKIESLQYQLNDLRDEKKQAREHDILEREMALEDPNPLKTLKETAITNNYISSDDLADEDEDENDSHETDFYEDTDVDFDDPFDEDDIYLIEQKDFEDDIKTRDNETLTFYQEDGVLVDDHNDRIENELRVVGKEFMDKVKDTDEDFLYVSNDIEDKMYEIVVNHNESFYRDIMGATV